MEIFASLLMFLVITGLVYFHVGLTNIRNSYGLWFKQGYWVNYNVVEAAAWLAKAAVILPGLVAKGSLAIAHYHLADFRLC